MPKKLGIGPGLYGKSVLYVLDSDFAQLSGDEEKAVLK